MPWPPRDHRSAPRAAFALWDTCSHYGILPRRERVSVTDSKQFHRTRIPEDCAQTYHQKVVTDHWTTDPPDQFNPRPRWCRESSPTCQPWNHLTASNGVSEIVKWLQTRWRNDCWSVVFPAKVLVRKHWLPCHICLSAMNHWRGATCQWWVTRHGHTSSVFGCLLLLHLGHMVLSMVLTNQNRRFDALDLS